MAEFSIYRVQGERGGMIISLYFRFDFLQYSYNWVIKSLASNFQLILLNGVTLHMNFCFNIFRCALLENLWNFMREQKIGLQFNTLTKATSFKPKRRIACNIIFSIFMNNYNNKYIDGTGSSEFIFIWANIVVMTS